MAATVPGEHRIAAYTAVIAGADLFSSDPAVRLAAARTLRGRARRSALKRVEGWPAFSPGSANAWLLLVTTKPPLWRDPLLAWSADPPALGEPHAGFFYPDPLGFWTEVRRWATLLLRTREGSWGPSEALSVTALLHVGEDSGRVLWAEERCHPHVTLFLDDAARTAVPLPETLSTASIPDPHRPGTVYEGWWAVQGDGRSVGKAPQHPASHRFYRASDMDGFLSRLPRPN